MFVSGSMYQHSETNVCIIFQDETKLKERSKGYWTVNKANKQLTFLRGNGESSGVPSEATSSPLTRTSTRLETSGGWDMIKSIWKVEEACIIPSHKMLIHFLKRQDKRMDVEHTYAVTTCLGFQMTCRVWGMAGWQMDRQAERDRQMDGQTDRETKTGRKVCTVYA